MPIHFTQAATVMVPVRDQDRAIAARRRCSCCDPDGNSFLIVQRA